MTYKKKSKKSSKKNISKKEKTNKKKKENNSLKNKKKETIHENKVLRNIFVYTGIILILMVSIYFYIKPQEYFNYKGVKFERTQMGKLIFYDTKTLAKSYDGTPFGFRLRTNPSLLKKIPFENLSKFKLMKVNGYTYSNNSFNCDGKGIIAMVNLKRLFAKEGMEFIRSPNSTCDSRGRYNYFILKYGNETGIKEVGNRCYDVVIKGNDTKCEILPATEKLMIELYVKYLNLK